jgi:NADH-quinone oxidoreductase subunit M
MITPVTLWSESAGFPLLTTLTLSPLVGIVTVLYSRSSVFALWSSYITAALNVILSLYLLMKFDDNKIGIQFAEQLNLFNLSYSVGVDGLNVLYIPLITCSTLLVLIYISATQNADNKRLIATVLGYQAILVAAFSALNLLQFWLLTALELVPIILTIRQSGLDQKKRFVVVRIMQFFGASLLMTLCGFMLLAFGLIDSEHDLTFDLLTLTNNNAYLHDETLIFILLFYGFAIRMPLFPFHGWLPLLAEQGSITSVTVFVIGLKLGVYAMIRFIFPLVPGVAEQWANYVLILCLISIFYGALLAFMQNNAYRLLSFATLSHTGMLVFGVFSFNEHGLEGTLLLSLVYGLASVGMLFSISLIHEQTKTAIIHRLGDLFDSHTTLALLFMITALSTMIMPGSLGFDAGHLLLEGVIEEHEWGVSVTILTGHVLAAGFLLWAFQRMFLATSKRHIHYSRNEKTINQERIIAFVVCALHIGTGLNSMPLLNMIDKDVVELVSQYPVHSSQQDATETSVADDVMDDKDTEE